MDGEGSMTLHYEDGGLRLFHGSNKDVLGADALGYPFEFGYHPDRLIPDASFDSIVTDPPYELGFMGKEWDSTGIAYDVEMWRECFRVLKPGGYLLSFGGTRTWHRIAVAIEDAGFEVRDSIAWMYGSGFPKSMDVAKAIDKARDDSGEVLAVSARLADLADAAGVTRRQVDEAMGTSDMGGWWLSRIRGRAAVASIQNWVRLRDLIPGAHELDDEVWRLNGRKGAWGSERADRVIGTPGRNSVFSPTQRVEDAGTPASEASKEWEGWGTALKPAFEPIIVARKPLAGTVAANVLAYGTGAINIDACRVGDEERVNPAGGASSLQRVSRVVAGYRENVSASVGAESKVTGRFPANVLLDESQAAELDRQAPNTGGAGRASGPTLTGKSTSVARGQFNGVEDSPFYGDRGGASRFFPTFRYEAKAPGSERPEVDGVAHATVKPLDLMRWLVRLVTRRGGRVLDPFAGSGTTGEAALLEGMDSTLIEFEEAHLPLILARVRKPLQPSMFGDWEDGVA